MRYQFIQDAEKAYPVRVLCAVMKVSTGGYYDWKTRDIPPTARKKQELVPLVRVLHEENEEVYGRRRMSDALKEKGHNVGKAAAGTLMKMAGVKVKTKRKFKATTDSNHDLPVASNFLERDFTADVPDRVWVSDITYIWTREGWLYLAVIIDLFSRRVVGWATSKRINTALIIEALHMAYWRRKPEKGLIFHTDRGSQYCSRAFQQRLKTYGMLSSMSRKGDCWDNAVAESFFATLKKEKIRGLMLITREHARSVLFRYIEIFYNGKRFHSYLGNLSPRIFEERWYVQISA